MGQMKECLRFFVVVFVPLIIFCVSFVAVWMSKRDDLVSKVTRDLAQIMYLVITFIGLTNFSTNIKLIGDKLTFDRLAVAIIAICCFTMSLSCVSEEFKDRCLDVIANGVSTFYLSIAFMVWRDGKEKNKSTLHTV